MYILYSTLETYFKMNKQDALIIIIEPEVLQMVLKSWNFSNYILKFRKN